MQSLMIFGRPVCRSCRARIAFLERPRSYSSAAGNGGSLVARRPERAIRTRLPDKPARTRFAPSPTGYLHLGSLRTALYNYLLARATNGQFLLRLEDTDQSRIVPDAETRLYEDLKWSGLSWDEGPDCGGRYGPYKQSQRLRIYQEYADCLLRAGKAFRCFCSHDDMAAHNQKTLQIDGTFGTYPGMCLSISTDESAERAAKGEAHTVRFRSSSSPVAVHDIVYGLYKKKLPEDHFIIMKSDGFPTYHFANVVDDHLMDITHVVRGAEWLISTAKHVSLYDAFGWEPPKFAHVGLLVDSNRQKLSKRNMDIGIDSYKRDGIPPPALLNFAALLGWNPGSSPHNKGVMSLDDMVKTFGLKFTKGDIVVNTEKLGFFHRKHIRRAIDAPSLENQLGDEYVTDPVLRKAREIEAQRRLSSADEVQAEPSKQNFLSFLGEPIIHLQPSDNASDNALARNRLRAILKISRSEATAAAGIVEANKYLIWQPSVRHIQDSYPRLLAGLDKIFVDNRPSSTVEVLEYFLARLEQIDDANWAAGSIQSALDDTTKRVVCYEEEKPPISVGYKFLRWALLGLDNGPQVSHLMEYLGKAETIRRMQLARSVSDSAPTCKPDGRQEGSAQERDTTLPTT